MGDTKKELIQNVLYEINKRKTPDAPFKSTHSLLLIKRLIREAAESGMDKIAWISGEQTADRYDLSKKISEVHYSGTNLKAYDHSGAEVISQTGVQESEIADYIGKEPAKRLLESEKIGTLRSITGEDLKVGGEWAVNLYDKSLPKQVGRFIKKYGSKVEVLNLGDGKEHSDKIGLQLGFEITPNMKAAALVRAVVGHGLGPDQLAQAFERRRLVRLCRAVNRSGPADMAAVKGGHSQAVEWAHHLLANSLFADVVHQDPEEMFYGHGSAVLQARLRERAVHPFPSVRVRA